MAYTESTETHACSPRGYILVAKEDINHWGNSAAPWQHHRMLSNQSKKKMNKSFFVFLSKKLKDLDQYIFFFYWSSS